MVQELQSVFVKFCESVYGGVPFLGGPDNKDYSIFGSILGYPYLGKPPYVVSCRKNTSSSDSVCQEYRYPKGPKS